MSQSLPPVSTIKRFQGETYAETWAIAPIPTGATFELQVTGLDTVAGTIDGQRVAFGPIPTLIADATVGTYAFKIEMTYEGTTRIIARGNWQISTP